jgi:uncharacterized delta-60 repeat protein
MKRGAVFVVAAAVVLTLPLWANAAAGDLDSSFGSGGKVLTDFGASSFDVATAVALERNGSVVVAGTRGQEDNPDFAVARYQRDGTLDQSFGSGGKVLTGFGASSFDFGTDVAVQPSGKVVVAGGSSASGSPDFALVRYDQDGSLDPSFGSGGKVLTDFGAVDGARAVAIQPNGKIVAGGESGNTSAGGPGSFEFALARYNADGSLDSSFGSDGVVLTDFDLERIESIADLALQPNGKIIAVGTSSGEVTNDFVLARYNGDGSLDSTFGSGGKVRIHLSGTSFDEANAVALEPNGKIIVGGSFDNGFLLARFDRNGSLDPSFGSGGKVLTDLGPNPGQGFAVAVAPSGKIVQAGWSGPDFALFRFNRDGSLDLSFGSAGEVLTHFGTSDFDQAHAVALEPNGKIVAAGGSFSLDNGQFALARYLAR